MFITVKFGERKEIIFNPNCRSIALLRQIRQKCNYTNEVIGIDLSDEEGNVKMLSDMPMRQASEVLKERETLVLVSVEKLEDGDYKYTPLLNDEEAITQEFLARLSSRNRRRSERPRSSRRSKDDKLGSRTGKAKDKEKVEREKLKSAKKERGPTEEYMKRKRGSLTERIPKSLLSTISPS
ncbi:uncharacterized protein LOC135499792 [Lineus longissimus]|uniref:uncharacterized protein LOC135499792 n=1 Tax=Lineus longissimus TaxID=88925 RepID=UPI002B4C9748